MRLRFRESVKRNNYLFLIARSPKTGPIARSGKTYISGTKDCNNTSVCILMMVIANPIQFTIVKAVPFTDGAARWATSVEKSGESAMTTIPQKMRNAMTTG